MKSARRVFWRISISLKLAVVVILSLTLCLIVATIMESMYDTPTAQYWVYKTWYFYGVLGTLGWLIFAVAMSRLPWQKKHLPFLCAHLGILLLLYGSWLTFKFGIDGSLQIAEDQAESAVELDEPLIIIAEGNAGAEATIRQIPVPWIPPNAKFTPIEIPEYGLHVEEFISRAESTVKFAPSVDSLELASPALRVKVAGGPSAPPFMKLGQEAWIWGGDANWNRQQVGPAILAMSGNPDYLPTIGKGPEASFRVDQKKSRLQVTVQTSDGKKREISYPYKDPKDLVGIAIPTGWKFDATITILEWIPRAKTEVTFKPSRIQYGANVSRSAIRLREGNSSIWLGLGDRATMDIRPKEGAKGRHFTIGYFPRRIVLPFAVRLRKFSIDRYQGTMSPSEFSSVVDVDGGTEPAVAGRLISMNEPLKYGGFTFYQTSYVDAQPRPTVSIFSVNQDPGRWLKYLGSLLIVLGSIWLFAMKYLKRSP
jgi:hypothetical protein